MSAQFLIKIRIFWLIPLFLVIFGCAPPSVTVKQEITPELAIITLAYQKAVRNAYLDKQKQWHHGRLGNIAVNLQGDEHVGLCYHWQWQVYTAVKPAAKSTRWRILGIAINEGSMYEHHAVLLYRPDQTRFEDILKKPYKTNIYVLDPWGSGQPLVYNLGNWLKLPVTLEAPARLTRIQTSKPPWKNL